MPTCSPFLPQDSNQFNKFWIERKTLTTTPPNGGKYMYWVTANGSVVCKKLHIIYCLWKWKKKKIDSKMEKTRSTQKCERKKSTWNSSSNCTKLRRSVVEVIVLMSFCLHLFKEKVHRKATFLYSQWPVNEFTSNSMAKIHF